MSGAIPKTAPLFGLAANPGALVAFPEAARPLGDILRLDVVADVARRLVVMHVHRQRRVPRAFLRHVSPPFDWDRRGAYIGTEGVGA